MIRFYALNNALILFTQPADRWDHHALSSLLDHDTL
jgi:hypothetical protein